MNAEIRVRRTQARLPEVIWLTDTLAVAGALNRGDMRRLVNEGFRSIIDLRADAEPRPQGLPPWEEADFAAEHGLVYEQIPIEPPRLSDALGRVVLRAIRAAAAPVLIHCTTGRRAGTFGLIALACAQPQSLEQCISRGRAMGLDFDGMPRLTEFLRQCIARHGIADPDSSPACEE